MARKPEVERFQVSENLELHKNIQVHAVFHFKTAFWRTKFLSELTLRDKAVDKVLIIMKHPSMGLNLCSTGQYYELQCTRKWMKKKVKLCRPSVLQLIKHRDRKFSSY